MRNFTITGRLGKDPEITETANGKVIAKLFILDDEIHFDEPTGTKTTKTHLMNVTLFGHHAKFAQKFARRGNNVLCHGVLQYHEWVDKNTGEKRSREEKVVFGAGGEFKNFGNPIKSDTPPADQLTAQEYTMATGG